MTEGYDHALLHSRPSTPVYRSRGEATLAGCFAQHGIRFLYEWPTLVWDNGRARTWHPDFTLPDYGNLIVEYAGMMDRPDYRASVTHKQAAFRANCLPAVFLYPSDLSGSGWAARLRSTLDTYRPRCFAEFQPDRFKCARGRATASRQEGVPGLSDRSLRCMGGYSVAPQPQRTGLGTCEYCRQEGH